MDVVRLTADHDLKPFDCGDPDLNGFLMDDAKHFMAQKIANTFLVYQGETVIAYFCLLNDKISRQEITNSSWRKIKKLFPHAKHFGSYPAVKIGRFAVSTEYRKQGIGSELLNIIKFLLSTETCYSAARFLTVDAYIDAIPFYEKNRFITLQNENDNGITQTMYFDLLSMDLSKL